eukprot:5583151-Pleurochrysis_carterae.AAC.1
MPPTYTELSAANCWVANESYFKMMSEGNAAAVLYRPTVAADWQESCVSFSARVPACLQF